jgi:integrase
VESENESVIRWLGRLRPSTAKSYQNRFNAFMRWIKEGGGRFADMTPDGLLEYQKKSDDANRYDILDAIQAYVSSLKLRHKSLKTTYAILRSFFLHNRCELPRDPSYRINSDVEPVTGDLSIEQIRDMVLSSNEVYRAVFLSIFQGSLDLSAFDHWNLNGWDKLRKDLQKKPNMIRIDIPGRKGMRNAKPFYSLIGGDAIDAIVNYLPNRPADGNAIFYTKEGKPVSKESVKYYWLRHLDRIGIIDRSANMEGKSKRYGKNLHEIRDVFRSQWEKSPAKGSVAEFMMGHLRQIDPNEYNKAFRDEEWVRDIYEDALPMLQIMSSDMPYGKISGTIVKTMQKQISDLEAQLKTEQMKQVDEAGTISKLTKRFDRLDDFIKRWVRDRMTEDEITEMDRVLDEIDETKHQKLEK